MHRNPHPPSPREVMLLRIVLLVFGGQIVVFFALHALFPTGSSVFGVFVDGWDYHYFYQAAHAWLAGSDPYRSVFGFVTPPFSMTVPLLLAHFSPDRAALFFRGFNLVLVPVSLWWYATALRLQLQAADTSLLSATLFISAHECVHGGNMDGMMFALLVAAFSVRRRLCGIALAWRQPGDQGLLGHFFACRSKEAAVALRRIQRDAGFVLLLPFHGLWGSALHALMGRSARYLQFSIAPATLVYALRGGITPGGSLLCSAFWVATLAIVLYRDHDRELSPGTLARYIPWMLAYPALVFSYVGVLALAVLASLVATAHRRPLHRAEQCVFVGFLLLGIHVEHATNLLSLAMRHIIFPLARRGDTVIRRHFDDPWHMLFSVRESIRRRSTR